MTPLAYFQSWKSATGSPAFIPRITKNPTIFCPAVTSATVARRYGVGLVTEFGRTPGPRGAIFDEKIGSFRLYRIPGAASATLTSLGSKGALPGVNALGTPVVASHPSPTTWKIVTDSATPKVLRLHLTDVPGWNGSI